MTDDLLARLEAVEAEVEALKGEADAEAGKRADRNKRYQDRLKAKGVSRLTLTVPTHLHEVIKAKVKTYLDAVKTSHTDDQHEPSTDEDDYTASYADGSP